MVSQWMKYKNKKFFYLGTINFAWLSD